MTDMSFRESFQKALLDNNDLIAKCTQVMEDHAKATGDLSTKVELLTQVIGVDESKGLQKLVCNHEKDIRGDKKEPGLWTVVTRVVWVTGSIVTIGGVVIVSYLTEHPDAFANLISKFFPGG